MPSGGYRRPTNPAPASGPGRLSKRTDGGPGQKLMVANGLDYGERQQTLAQERTTPMSQADPISPMDLSAPSAGSPATAGPAAQAMDFGGVGFGGPSTRPNEPITHGVDIGPGAGPEALPVQARPQYATQGPTTQLLARLSASDQSGALASLYQSALALGA